jgi:hypothetical protein
MMKTKLMIFLLASAVVVFAQHGAGGSHSGGMGNGGGGMASSSHGSESRGGDMGHNPTAGSQMGKQSPDTILSRNTKLSSNLEKLLPSGMKAQEACSGFRNLGQCVAAIHVANNLNIPFADLKTKMTGDGSESLGKAIHELKPDANAKVEAKKGQKQAGDDLSSTS